MKGKDNDPVQNKNSEKQLTEGKICYRVVEYLFQDILPLHGKGMDKYDCRTIKKRINSKEKADTLAEELRSEASRRKLSHHLRYEVETYFIKNSKKSKSK